MGTAPRFPRRGGAAQKGSARADRVLGANALKALIDSAEIDCHLVVKLILAAQHAETRPILDALTTANLSRIGEVRDEVCRRLDSISAARREAAE